MARNKGDVITMVASDPDISARDMTGIERAAYFYQNKLGLNDTAILWMSLIYQFVIALFVGVNAMRWLPILEGIPAEGFPLIIKIALAVIAGFIFQILLIFEMAKVVWIRRSDRFKVRLESQSWWWFILLAALILCFALDSLLITMSITGTVDFKEALGKIATNSLTLCLNCLMIILNWLTLLRCASIMRITTVEQNRKDVEEYLATITSEIMLESGDEMQERTRRFWQTLNINPSKFLPLENAVLGLVAQQYKDYMPELANLGGDTWGYDFSTHSLVNLPPDLYHALSGARGHVDRISDEELKELLLLDNAHLARQIGANLKDRGKFKLVDATDPEDPEFIYDQPNWQEATQRQPAPAPARARQVKSLDQVLVSNATANARPAITNSFNLADMPPVEASRFANYLKRVYREVYGEAFAEGSGLNIFDCFDPVELAFYQKQFKKMGGGQ
jgi:hypothetical protein